MIKIRVVVRSSKLAELELEKGDLIEGPQLPSIAGLVLIGFVICELTSQGTRIELPKHMCFCNLNPAIQLNSYYLGTLTVHKKIALDNKTNYW